MVDATRLPTPISDVPDAVVIDRSQIDARQVTFAQDILVLVLLPVALVVIERRPMAREERYMEQKFGDAFRAYPPWVRP